MKNNNEISNKDLLYYVLSQRLENKNGANGKPYSDETIRRLVDELDWKEKEEEKGFLLHTIAVPTSNGKKNSKLENRENKLTVSSDQSMLNFELLLLMKIYLPDVLCILSLDHNRSDSQVIIIIVKVLLEGLRKAAEEKKDETYGDIESVRTQLLFCEKNKDYAGVIHYAEILEKSFELTLTLQHAIACYKYEAYSGIIEKITQSNLLTASRPTLQYYEPIIYNYYLLACNLENKLEEQGLAKLVSLTLQAPEDYTSDLNLISTMQYYLNTKYNDLVKEFCIESWIEKMDEYIQYCKSLQQHAPNSDYLSQRLKSLNSFKNICEKGTLRDYLDFFSSLEKKQLKKIKRHKNGILSSEIPVLQLPLAHSYMKLEKWNEAEKLFKDISQKTPHIFFCLGRIAIKKGYKSQAKEYLLVATQSKKEKLNSTDWRMSHFLLGCLYHEEAYYEEAIDHYLESGIPSESSNPNELARLFCALLSSNKAEEKKETFDSCRKYLLEKALNNFEGIPDVVKLSDKTNHPKLFEFYKALLKQYAEKKPDWLKTPEGLESLRCLCINIFLTYSRSDMDKETVENIEWALNQLSPSDKATAVCFAHLGQYYFTLSLYDKALTYYYRALRVFSDLCNYPNICEGLLLLLEKIDSPIDDFYQNLLVPAVLQQDEALGICVEALGKQSRHVKFFEKLALEFIQIQTLNDKENIKNTSAFISFCIAVPHLEFNLSPETLQKLIATLVSLKFRPSEAVREDLLAFCERVNGDSFNSNHHFNLCQLYLKLGNTAKAIETFSFILKREPNFSLPKKIQQFSFYSELLPYIPKKEDQWICYRELCASSKKCDSEIFLEFLNLSFELDKLPGETLLTQILIYFIKRNELLPKLLSLLEEQKKQDKKNSRHCNQIKEILADELTKNKQKNQEKLEKALILYKSLLENTANEKKKNEIYYKMLKAYCLLYSICLKKQHSFENESVIKVAENPLQLSKFTSFYKKTSLEKLALPYELCLKFVDILTIQTSASPYKIFWIEEAFKIAINSLVQLSPVKVKSLMKDYLLKFHLLKEAIQLCSEISTLNEPSVEENLTHQLIEYVFRVPQEMASLPDDKKSGLQDICQARLSFFQKKKLEIDFQQVWKIFFLFPNLGEQIKWDKNDTFSLFDKTLQQTEPYQSIFKFIKLSYVQVSEDLLRQLAIWALEEEEKTPDRLFDLITTLIHQCQPNHLPDLIKFATPKAVISGKLTEFLTLLKSQCGPQFIDTFWALLNQNLLHYTECLPYLPSSTRNTSDFHQSMIRHLCQTRQFEEAILYVEKYIDSIHANYFSLFSFLLSQINSAPKDTSAKALNLLLEKLKIVDIKSLNLKTFDSLLENSIRILPDSEDQPLSFQFEMLTIKMRLQLMVRDKEVIGTFFCIRELNKDDSNLARCLEEFTTDPAICTSLAEALLKKGPWGVEAVNTLLGHLKLLNSSPAKKAVNTIEKLLQSELTKKETETTKAKETKEIKTVPNEYKAKEKITDEKISWVNFFKSPQTPLTESDPEKEKEKENKEKVTKTPKIFNLSKSPKGIGYENNPEPYWKKAFKFHKDRKWSKCIEYANKITPPLCKRTDYYALGEFLRGSCYQNLENYPETYTCYIAALKYHREGKGRLRDNQISRIERWLKTHPEAKLNDGIWAYENKEFLRAISLFSELISSVSKNYYALTYFYIGLSFLAMGDYQQAMLYLKEAEEWNKGPKVRKLNDRQSEIIQEAYQVIYQNIQSIQNVQNVQNVYYPPQGSQNNFNSQPYGGYGFYPQPQRPQQGYSRNLYDNSPQQNPSNWNFQPYGGYSFYPQPQRPQQKYSHNLYDNSPQQNPGNWNFQPYGGYGYGYGENVFSQPNPRINQNTFYQPYNDENNISQTNNNPPRENQDNNIWEDPLFDKQWKWK